MSKTNFEVHMKHMKVLLSGEMKLVMSSVCTISLNFEGYSLEFQFRKCKKDFDILNIILVQDFCPLKTEIDRSPIGFPLDTVESRFNNNNNNNNNALLALTTKRHIYMTSDKLQ